MKKQSFKFYSHEETEELQSISKLRTPGTRRAALKQFCTKYSRNYDAAYGKLNAIKNIGSRQQAAIASTSEVRIPFRNVRVEGNEVIFSF